MLTINTAFVLVLWFGVADGHAIAAKPPAEAASLIVAARPAARAKPVPARKTPAPPPPKRPAPVPEPPVTIQEPVLQAAPAPGGAGLSGSNRIEFDAQLIKGQTTKAGEVQVLERKNAELKSMIKRRTSFRDEIIRTAFPEK